ncbi:ectoine synthase [Halothiobacillus sp.]|jgi:L-ectoine synthase|uniref:ectoine synthase n=1 Tax=Halothiobacillus sp. TaxID=1891311 RepID=UPI002A3AB5E3|nr:ectoine synthase [Halothiobacillus sp.]
MIVRRLTPDILGTDREVESENGNWVSRRLVLADDGVGFSFHDTIIRAGTETYIHYANHIEAVYCVAGNGEIHDIANDTTHKISDGMMYLLNNHDRHYLRGGTEDMRLICVFNPPLTGKEVHDENGHYPLMS